MAEKRPQLLVYVRVQSGNPHGVPSGYLQGLAAGEVFSS